MNISLIGMSGSGKSYWSKKLEQKGFRRLCVDELIEQKLNKELKQEDLSGIGDVAKWMGFPFEKKYKAASNKYLALEKEIMGEILNSLKNQKDIPEHIVIDTTGSVTYTGKEILRELSRLTTIVYLEIPESGIRYMYELFLNDPKPVLWGKLYHKKSGETDNKALKRCYPDLLSYRSKQYKKIAHHIVECNRYRESSENVESFLDSLNSVNNTFHDNLS